MSVGFVWQLRHRELLQRCTTPIGVEDRCLCPDKDLRIINKPLFLHLLSTVGMLRGLERFGVLGSSDDVIHEMTHPTAANRRPTDARIFKDL